MGEDKSTISVPDIVLKWLPIIFVILGWIWIAGKKDSNVDVLTSQNAELRESIKELRQKEELNHDAIGTMKGNQDYLQRELDEERRIRDQRR